MTESEWWMREPPPDPVAEAVEYARPFAESEQQPPRPPPTNGNRRVQPEEHRPWQPIDLRPFLDGTRVPIEPAIGRRSDGIALFYEAKHHTVASESEAGKTFLVLAVALYEMRRGNGVVFVDCEDSEAGVAGRLLDMGATAQQLTGLFGYIRPDAPITTDANRHDLGCALRDLRPKFVIVDGVTEAMSMHGLDPLKNLDAAKYLELIPRPITTQFSAAVASCDHVTKDPTSRGRYALGAVHKLNGVDGASFVLDNRTPLGVGRTGRSTLLVAKDRPGQLRRHGQAAHDGLTWFGDLVVKSSDTAGMLLAESSIDAQVDAPNGEASGWRPTRLMGKVAGLLGQASEPLSQVGITDRAGGKAETVRQALSFLVDDGYVRVDLGPRGAKLHRLVRPFTEPEASCDPT